MNEKNLYVSIDIEADGPCPGLNSMLSLGAAAYSINFNNEVILESVFEVNLEPMANCSPDQETMEWWGHSSRKKAWDYIQRHKQKPLTGVQLFVNWIKALQLTHHGKLIGLANPVSFDSSFICYYLQYYYGTDIFERRFLDIRSYIAGRTAEDFSNVSVSKLLIASGKDLPHTPLADAKIQADLFFKYYLKIEE